MGSVLRPQLPARGLLYFSKLSFFCSYPTSSLSSISIFFAAHIMSKVEDFHVSHDPIEAEDDVFGKALPARYVGTAADRHDMSILGKKQVLRRQFKFSTMLGFASTVMVAWEFVLLVSPFTLQDGGTAGVFWVR